MLEIFLKSCVKLDAFQIILLPFSQNLMSQNFGYLEITSQSMINKSIQIMFVMLKLYINKPVEVLTRNMMDLHDGQQ